MTDLKIDHFLFEYPTLGVRIDHRARSGRLLEDDHPDSKWLLLLSFNSSPQSERGGCCINIDLLS